MVNLDFRTTSILNSILHLFSTFRQRLMATKLVTLNLWRNGRVKRQGRSAIRDNWILLSQDTTGSYSLYNLRSKQCSVKVRSTEHRIQGCVKFGQVKGSSSRYILVCRPGSHQFERDIISLTRTSTVLGGHRHIGRTSTVGVAVILGGHCKRSVVLIVCVLHSWWKTREQLESSNG